MMKTSDAMPRGLPRLVMKASESAYIHPEERADLRELAEWLYQKEIREVKDFGKRHGSRLWA